MEFDGLIDVIRRPRSRDALIENTVIASSGFPRLRIVPFSCAPNYAVKVRDMLLIEIQSASLNQLIETIESWGLKLDMEMEQRGIHISRIEVPRSLHGAGLGTRAMQAICDYADKNNVAIALTPDNSFGGNVKRLFQFYKRFGFVENKGRNKDFIWMDRMYRRPKKS